MIKCFCCFLFLPLCLFGRVLILTTAFNRPDFIELQHKLFAKFLQDEYEFLVINDANTPQMQEDIKKTCHRLHIPCHQVPQSIHDEPYLLRGPDDNYNNPNVRHCNSVQWAWNNFFSYHDGPVMIIDSDMFLIRPFSIEKTLKDVHFAGIFWGTTDMQTGEPYSYLWLALILLNNPFLPEKDTICFNCGLLPNTQAICDSGGWTYFYLNKFKNLLKLHNLGYLQGHHFFCPYRYAPVESQNFDHLSANEITQNLQKRGFTQNEISLILKKPYTIELLGDNHFLHYRAGTNYEKYSDEFISEKDVILQEFFQKILSPSSEQQ